MEDYKTKLLLDKKYDFGKVFADKQKYLSEQQDFDFDLKEAVSFLKEQSDNFKSSSPLLKQIDDKIFDCVVKYQESIGEPLEIKVEGKDGEKKVEPQVPGAKATPQEHPGGEPIPGAPEPPKPAPKAEPKAEVPTDEISNTEKKIKGYQLKMKLIKDVAEKSLIEKKIKGYELRIKMLKKQAEKHAQGGKIGEAKANELRNKWVWVHTQGADDNMHFSGNLSEQTFKEAFEELKNNSAFKLETDTERIKTFRRLSDDYAVRFSLRQIYESGGSSKDYQSVYNDVIEYISTNELISKEEAKMAVDSQADWLKEKVEKYGITDLDRLSEHIMNEAPVTYKRGGGLCPVGTVIQSLIFSKEHFTKAESVAWAKRHDKKADVDEKENTYRLRQFHPSKANKYHTITITKGIKAVIGCPVKKEDGGVMELTSFEISAPANKEIRLREFMRERKVKKFDKKKKGSRVIYTFNIKDVGGIEDFKGMSMKYGFEFTEK